MRYRNIVLFLGSLIVLAALFFTDPDRGYSTSILLIQMAVPLVGVALAHLCRKALFDYREADARSLFRTAMESPSGAGLALVAMSIVTAAALLAFSGAARAGGIPPAAGRVLPIVSAEMDRWWPDAPMREYPAGLIEHESCITLTHARCWQPTSRLKTHREEGAGLGQLTRAYRPDGSLRFDALAEMRSRHPALRELDWQTIYGRPDLQVRALILQARGNYAALPARLDPGERLAMADAAYNGGSGRVAADRRACMLKPGCDPARWWGHVEATCTASRVALYGSRSACDINRHHVADVMRARAPKYRGLV